MPPPRFSLEPEIRRYYEASREAERLEDPVSRWEKVRTLDLLDRFLPPAPAVILDVGAAAGAYAFSLAQKGYTVDLIDPVSMHLKQARQHATIEQCAPRSCLGGDARAIPFENKVADAVLFFGPLNHLTSADDRLQAIREAHRVLRTGGVLMAVAISRFASALAGIAQGSIRDQRFVQIVEQDLRTGQHRNETDNLCYFTTAYFHRPEEFRMELAEGGFPDPYVCAIEGPIWNVQQFTSAEQQGQLMATVSAAESEAALIGASAHIMGIGTKQNE